MNALEISMTVLRSGLLSGFVGHRIFPIVSPRATDLPYIVASIFSESDDEILSGAAQYYTARISVDAVARTATEAAHIGEAVKLLLENIGPNAQVQNGESPPETVGLDVNFYKDDADFIDHSDDRSIFRRKTDWSMTWRRAP